MQINNVQSAQNPSFNARIQLIRKGCSEKGPSEILGSLIDRARYIGTDNDLIRVEGGTTLQSVFTPYDKMTCGSMRAEFIRNGKLVHRGYSSPEPGGGTEDKLRNFFSDFLSQCR